MQHVHVGCSIFCNASIVVYRCNNGGPLVRPALHYAKAVVCPWRVPDSPSLRAAAWARRSTGSAAAPSRPSKQTRSRPPARPASRRRLAASATPTAIFRRFGARAQTRTPPTTCPHPPWREARGQGRHRPPPDPPRRSARLLSTDTGRLKAGTSLSSIATLRVPPASRRRPASACRYHRPAPRPARPPQHRASNGRGSLRG